MRFICAVSIFFLSLWAPHPAAADGPDTPETWNWHYQATLVPQGHGSFPADYSGTNSLKSTPELATSFTTTFFLGLRLWPGAEAYADPELSAGSGLSDTHGVAAFPNGEIYRVGSPAPQANLARAFLQQTVGLGGADEPVDSDQNQLAGRLPGNRVTLIAGKFSLNDYFDDNAYAHDPRTQFLSWGFMDDPSWDYAADVKGYTWGGLAELRLADWSLRAASVLENAQANSSALALDWPRDRGDNAELEWRGSDPWGGRTLRLLGYRNQADMGSYATALQEADAGVPDVTPTRAPRVKAGFGLNLEQALGANGGCFARLGWADGQSEAWSYTEADASASVGLQWKGTAWGRDRDQWGAGLLADGLSAEHRDYLAAGGLGFMLGDGALDYGPENVAETYYAFGLGPWLSLSLDFQEIVDPGYNRARGPASVEGARLHLEL